MRWSASRILRSWRNAGNGRNPIPEDLNGFHKLVIYEKLRIKKQPGFLLQRVSWRKKETRPQVYFEEEKAEQGTVRHQRMGDRAEAGNDPDF